MDPEEPEEGEAGWRPVLPFTSDDVNFALGFEAGLVYAKMRERELVVEGTYHNLNDEQLLLMARSLGYSAQFNRLDDTWMAGRFTRNG